MPVWVIATPCPAIVKTALRLCAPKLPVMAQGAALPEIEIDAQLTLDPAEVGGQSPGTGVIAMLPDAPAEPALMLFVLNP